MNVVIFGQQAGAIRDELTRHPVFKLVDDAPDVVVCYGGDGTLLSAELEWPGVPKVPIRNSRRGIRMMDHPPGEIIERLARGKLVRTEFIKVECHVRAKAGQFRLRALNEINVQLGKSNTAVRFKMWIDDEPFEHGVEIIGDGFVVSTPFGSTAYYKQITRGIFHVGLGIAFKFTNELINHLVVAESSRIRAEITRGPALLGNDNVPDDIHLDAGDELLITRDPQNAVVLAWEPLRRPSEEL